MTCRLQKCACLFLVLVLFACKKETAPVTEKPCALNQCSLDCVDLRESEQHCGSCDRSCAEGEYCLDGSCQGSCSGGLLATCDGSCIDQGVHPEHCGSCEQVCAADEVCSGGKCGRKCDGATPSQCGTSCTDPTTDRLNCGECGRSCADDEFCSEGACRRSCSGRTPDQCGVSCVDRETDPAHCGDCFSSCDEDKFCVQGVCRESCAGSRPLLCAGRCVDPLTDANFCGNCQTVCAAGHRCSEGLCVAGCDAPGQSVCSGLCVDLSTDLNHCGQCGAACVDGSVCRDGICARSCGEKSECSGRCTDLEKDSENCGSCGNSCETGLLCNAGVCSLHCEGQRSTPCGSSCVDSQIDATHCGECSNACAPGSLCKAGRCTALCAADAPALCEGVCVHSLSDPKNCGSCGIVCSDGQHCSAGSCTRTFTDAVAGWGFACAKSGGEWTCWGDNENGEVSPTEPLENGIIAPLQGLDGEVLSLGLGWDHACAIARSESDPLVQCWGKNDGGQVNGLPGVPSLSGVQTVSLPSPATSLAIGHGHSCALLESGRVFCWGNAAYHAAGATSAVEDLGLSGVVEVTSGGGHSCARTDESDGSRVYCWGSNFVGQLGSPGVIFTGSMPVEVPGVSASNASVITGRTLVAGGGNTCSIIAGGMVSCWGDNLYGQLGRGVIPATDEHLPAPVVSLPGPAQALYGGDAFVCALLQDATLYCWGKHQASGSESALIATPEKVAEGVSSAAVHTNLGFALLKTGELMSWGSASAEELFRAPFGRYEPRRCCEY